MDWELKYYQKYCQTLLFFKKMLKRLLCKLGIHQIKVETVIRVSGTRTSPSITYGRIVCENCPKEIGKIVIDIR